MVDAPRHAEVVFLTQLQLETPSHASDLFIYFSTVKITICEKSQWKCWVFMIRRHSS